MGAHWQVYRLYTSFANAGYLQNINKVLDFGSCDTSCFGEARFIKEFVDALRGHNYLPDADYARLDNKPISAMWKSVGIGADCLDIDGRPGTIQLDLNYQSPPPSMKGAYDFVCDNGTFEHILNQLNCFRAAHDVCATNGLMFYHKPFIGHYNHGFFNYQPDLFVQLAAANQYTIEGLWYGVDHDPGYAQIDLAHPPKTHHAILFTLLRKTKDAEFKLPYNFNGSDLMGREASQYCS
jgi:hypothetical protein